MKMRLPAMTDPMGRHWSQPHHLHERVGVYFCHAVIRECDWLKLSRYESSIPSGVYPGKVWRNRKWLCWYGHERNGFCRIIILRALVVNDGVQP